MLVAVGGFGGEQREECMGRPADNRVPCGLPLLVPDHPASMEA